MKNPLEIMKDIARNAMPRGSATYDVPADDIQNLRKLLDTPEGPYLARRLRYAAAVLDGISGDSVETRKLIDELERAALEVSDRAVYIVLSVPETELADLPAGDLYDRAVDHHHQRPLAVTRGLVGAFEAVHAEIGGRKLEWDKETADYDVWTAWDMQSGQTFIVYQLEVNS